MIALYVLSIIIAWIFGKTRIAAWEDEGEAEPARR